MNAWLKNVLACNEDLASLLRTLGACLVGAICVGMAAMVVFYDVLVLHKNVIETSATEIAQALLLITMITAYAALAVKDREMRPAYTLIAGFFGTILVRELDFLSDAIYHGAWFPLALAVALPCIVYAVNRRERALAGLRVYCASRPFYLVLAGLFAILIFSRFLGMRVLWQAVLGEEFVRTAKNIVEEGIELFGYTLSTLGSLAYTRMALPKAAENAACHTCDLTGTAPEPGPALYARQGLPSGSPSPLYASPRASRHPHQHVSSAAARQLRSSRES